MYIFDSSATNERNYKVKPEWCKGLPKVKGRYGCPTVEEWPSYVCVSKTGSMTENIFTLYTEKILLELYPNLSPDWQFGDDGKVLKGPVLIKTDMGPGRLIATNENVDWRKDLCKRGVYYLGSCPNSTSVTAEMDDQFGSYKGACRISAQRCYNEKLWERMLKIKEKRSNPNIVVPSTCSLSPADLSMITNGKEDDPIDQKPFDKVFTKKNNLKAWSNIGFVPFTRKALKNKKVRHELQETVPLDNKLDKLQHDYESSKSSLKELGFNEDVFSAEIPKAFKIRQEQNDKDQVEALVKNNKTFSASGIFMHTRNMVFNSKNVIEAERISLKAVEDERIKKAQEKDTELRNKRAIALLIFQKYEANPDSLKSSDWKSLLSFLLHATNDTAKVSHFKNAQQFKDKCIEMDFFNKMQEYRLEDDLRNVIPLEDTLENPPPDPATDGLQDDTTEVVPQALRTDLEEYTL